ncbi:hypothetical protein [Paenibacillus hunanensis]|uniref:Phage head morphogenesis domain-containing protein n=1 Tax=Paenibacillus hunanensis TaxID=539262 RepID=A0ABU1IWT5_9BACL|nr:hypothetical protein [Paenibacillus hunanensis]MDR6243157.1 hypothetical protein [Paenibacillus hunanensis]GGJ11382.1 hypothetical protein GCM10008022_20680 [Paenibacillus hunanensis]
MPKVNIQLPPELRSFSDDDKLQVIEEIRKALNVSKPKPDVHDGRSMWEPSDDSLIAQLEDGFYMELDEAARQVNAETVALLDLPDDQLQKSGKIDRFKALVKKFRDRFSALKNKFKRKSAADILQKVDDLWRQRLGTLSRLAEKYIVRSTLAARLRIEAEDHDIELPDDIVDKLPVTIKAAQKDPFPFTLWDKQEQIELVTLSPAELSAMEYAVLSAAEKINQISDSHRAGVKNLVIQSIKERWGADKLSQALFDAYSTQNRDWRRVAITELAMATNDAYIAGLQEGDEVKVPIVPGACKHCQRLLEGKTFTVSATPHEDGNKYVWAGKSNIGRTVANWWACSPLHPHCRHRWIRSFHKGGEKKND